MDEASPFELDPAFLSTDLEDWDPTLVVPEPWEEFVNYPSELDTSYDFFPGPADLLSPESSFASSAATTMSSPSNADTPSSQSNPSLQQRTDGLAQGLRLQTCGGSLQVLGQDGTPELYEDFNLYSPSSSFSEDERMISIGSWFSPSSQQSGAELGPSTEQLSGGAMRLTEGDYPVLQESSSSRGASGDEWHEQSWELAGLESLQQTTEGAATGSTQGSGLASAPESKVQPGGDEMVVRVRPHLMQRAELGLTQIPQHSDLRSGLTRTTVPVSSLGHGTIKSFKTNSASGINSSGSLSIRRGIGIGEEAPRIDRRRAYTSLVDDFETTTNTFAGCCGSNCYFIAQPSTAAFVTAGG